VRREQAAIAQGAGVGCEPHTQAALDELDAQRLGGKQMTAGTAGGE
jgi:hypothetical protein